MRRCARVGSGDTRIAVHEDLAAIGADWRAFEAQADGTVFQCFDWLATWQRLIGARQGVRPAIVIVHDGAGTLLLLLPLAVRAAGPARELTWLGSDLCDYNAPLLAQDFAARIDGARFMALWAEIVRRLQDNPRLRFDFLKLEKMPETVGAQPNPMRPLGGTMTPSGAYLTHLTGDWETFYAAKRSPATRRRDRTKRKKLGEFGAVKLVNPAGGDEILHTLDTLMAQKARSFARMGVANLFAKPGYAEFYRTISTDPASRHLVHVSRLDVGDVRRRGQSRTDVARLLLSSAGELRRRRTVALRAGRRASARSAALRDRPRFQGVRFHHRRRALQARLVRHRTQTL